MISYTSGVIQVYGRYDECGLSELLDAMAHQSQECLVCSLHTQYAIDALEDGEYLASIDANQEAVEKLHAILKEANK